MVGEMRESGGVCGDLITQSLLIKCDSDLDFILKAVADC